MLLIVSIAERPDKARMKRDIYDLEQRVQAAFDKAKSYFSKFKYELNLPHYFHPRSRREVAGGLNSQVYGKHAFPVFFHFPHIFRKNTLSKIVF